MLRVVSPLYFPKLIRIGEVTFKAWSDSPKSTNIYKLDWSEAERIKKEKFEKWANNHAGTSDSLKKYQYFPELPQEYDEWLKDFTIALPANYYKTIREFSRRGLEVWSSEYSFDTMIRELCLKPAQAYIEVAFKLIADCLYDAGKNYFYRGDDKILFAHAALYKFWNGQTGRGLLERNADFDRLKSFTKITACVDGDMQKHKIVRKFLDDIKEYQKQYEIMYHQISEERNPIVTTGNETSSSHSSNQTYYADLKSNNTGPSLGEKD